MSNDPGENPKIEVLLCLRRELRNTEKGLAEINPAGDSFYLKMPSSALGRKGEAAFEILRAHVIAATRASKNISEGGIDSGISAVVKQHIEQQINECSCGKRGFEELAYCAVDKYGLTTNEYRCSYCGATQSFTTNHSDLLARLS